MGLGPRPFPSPSASQKNYKPWALCPGPGLSPKLDHGYNLGQARLQNSLTLNAPFKPLHQINHLVDSPFYPRPEATFPLSDQPLPCLPPDGSEHLLKKWCPLTLTCLPSLCTARLEASSSDFEAPPCTTEESTCAPSSFMEANTESHLLS